MYLIVIAWMYVTVTMALAEAFSPGGSMLGAAMTFTLYGLLPMGLLVYILGTPARKRKLHARREAEHAAWLAQQPPHAQAPSAPTASTGSAAAADMPQAESSARL